jgi:hypothetical protein
MGADRPGPGPPPNHLPQTESYAKALGNLGVVLVVVLALVAVTLRRSVPTAEVAAAIPNVEIGPISTIVAESPKPPEPAPAPQLDGAAVERAQAALDAARRDRLRAEARAQEAATSLEAASANAASDALAARTLASRVRDPSARIRRATENGSHTRAERDRLEGEVAHLSQVPKPKRKSLVDRTPVARPAEGKEFHFELRRNRVAFIDLEHLLERVLSDFKLRVRMNHDSQPIVGTVGPIGVFSLRYEIGRGLGGLDDLIETRGPIYNMRSFEVIPEFEGRGESYELAFRPASDFARAITRLNPNRDTVTLWVYPDSFGLYRKLRDELHRRGFLVAARPMPESMPIKGSPAGSLSAGQ